MKLWKSRLHNLPRSCQPAGEFRQAVLPLDGDHLLKVLREDGGADAGQRAEVPGDGLAARPALGWLVNLVVRFHGCNVIF